MASTDDPTTVADSIVTEYATYEHYLDAQITPNDLFYLEVRMKQQTDLFVKNSAHRE